MLLVAGSNRIRYVSVSDGECVRTQNVLSPCQFRSVFRFDNDSTIWLPTDPRHEIYQFHPRTNSVLQVLATPCLEGPSKWYSYVSSVCAPSPFTLVASYGGYFLCSWNRFTGQRRETTRVPGVKSITCWDRTDSGTMKSVEYFPSLCPDGVFCAVDERILLYSVAGGCFRMLSSVRASGDVNARLRCMPERGLVMCASVRRTHCIQGFDPRLQTSTRSVMSFDSTCGMLALEVMSPSILVAGGSEGCFNVFDVRKSRESLRRFYRFDPRLDAAEVVRISETTFVSSATFHLNTRLLRIDGKLLWKIDSVADADELFSNRYRSCYVGTPIVGYGSSADETGAFFSEVMRFDMPCRVSVCHIRVNFLSKIVVSKAIM